MMPDPVLPTITRAVRLDRYGSRDVLEVRDVPMPHPAAGEALVAVRAAGINPGEATIRSGALDAVLPATFPSGQGTDLSGTVIEVGTGVRSVSRGDAVLGYSWRRSSHAAHVVVPADQLIPKPDGLAWEVAGALDVAGTTAWAAVHSLGVAKGEVVVVSGATGGVGVLVVQLLVRRGAIVLAIASGRNAGWLSDHGATLVSYGDRLAECLRAAAPTGIDAFIDLFGPEYVRLAVKLGVPVSRIGTIVPSKEGTDLGVRMIGAAALADNEVSGVLRELAGLLADSALELPIAATYPLDRVTDAFERLEQRRTLGKIVLIP